MYIIKRWRQIFWEIPFLCKDRCLDPLPRLSSRTNFSFTPSHIFLYISCPLYPSEMSHFGKSVHSWALVQVHPRLLEDCWSSWLILTNILFLSCGFSYHFLTGDLLKRETCQDQLYGELQEALNTIGKVRDAVGRDLSYPLRDAYITIDRLRHEIEEERNILNTELEDTKAELSLTAQHLEQCIVNCNQFVP